MEKLFNASASCPGQIIKMRTFLTQPSYDELLQKFLGMPATAEMETEHAMLVARLVSVIQTRGLCPQDDIFVLYDYFRNKLVFLTVDPGFQKLAEDITKQVLRQCHSTFGIVIEPETESLEPRGLRELVCLEGIFVLDPAAD
jgi:hypothetical protein